MELDERKILQNKGALALETFNIFFQGFFLQGKDVSRKTVLFVQETHNPKYPFSNLAVDKYSIEVYVKTGGNQKYKLYTTKPVSLTEEMYSDWKKHSPVYVKEERHFEK